MNLLALGLFAAGLLLCLLLHISVLYALAFGYIVFFCYGCYRHLSVKELLTLSWQGIKTIRMVLIVFCLIGLITVTWRASGTIPFLVYEAGQFISPNAFLLLTFLLNCMLSVLIGTSFGTAATMGVICMSIGNVMGYSPVLLSGAILSGIYFGDRCSPLSTSALVVATITKTDLFTNLRRMAVRAAVPFLLSCLFYGAAGYYTAAGAVDTSALDRFQQAFVLSWPTLLPALVVIAMSIFRVTVWKTMLVSIVAALCLCFFVQDMDIWTLLPMLFSGYAADRPDLAPMLNGGGLFSMAQPAVLVALSCSYAGIFEKTDLLDGVKAGIQRLAGWLTAFGCTIAVSLSAVAITCNQTLSSIMVHELCRGLYRDEQEMALALEDTTIVLAAVLPWSIAAAVPLATLGASSWGIAAAVYLYLQPLWSWLRSCKN
jgi:Na+:H+ antiporter, NhaC family